jgi:hypothetical protein
MHYVQLLKSICPSVQYVRIADWAWQIIAKRDSSGIPTCDTQDEMELLELSWDETLAIELFSIDRLGTSSGLPAPEVHHRENS